MILHVTVHYLPLTSRETSPWSTCFPASVPTLTPCFWSSHLTVPIEQRRRETIYGFEVRLSKLEGIGRSRSVYRTTSHPRRWGRRRDPGHSFEEITWTKWSLNAAPTAFIIPTSILTPFPPKNSSLIASHDLTWSDIVPCTSDRKTVWPVN